MEIEKTRETSWKIQLKKINECIEITSVEISGEVRLIKLALINNDNIVKVEMKKEEFFNFLSLISAFKDVVIGEESFIIDEDLDLNEDKNLEIQEEVPTINSELLEIPPDTGEKNTDNSDNEELNPEEWDPW
ncbi:MAG: hypothetical protein ACFFDY_03250 [Candidatus Thorarchaeota archaeon]